MKRAEFFKKIIGGATVASVASKIDAKDEVIEQTILFDALSNKAYLSSIDNHLDSRCVEEIYYGGKSFLGDKSNS